MLSELTIKDFAIIDKLTLQFSPGFNVLTGETGAGKSIILDAMSLLLGGRASNDAVRSGAEKALIEGIFVLESESTRALVDSILAREELEGDSPDVLVLTREVRRGGRNICRANGHVVTVAILQELSEGLIDIHGQTEHLSLLKPSYHLDLLDRYGGLVERRRAFADLVRQVEALRSELHDLITHKEERAMRAEMLAFKAEEIRAANLKPGEEDELRDEARRLANAEQLTELVREAYSALVTGVEGGVGAADLLSTAASALARLVKIDPEAEAIGTLAEELSIQVEELGRSLADYEESIEFDPVRLQQAELRVDLIRSLKRKYHVETIEELIDAAEKAAAEVETIEGSSGRIEELEAQEAVLLARIGEAAAELSEARKACAARLSRAVETELSDLRMPDAQFGVSIEQADDPAGAPVGDYRLAFDRTGIDQVEFLISPNIGEPLKPIARIASGGETSRIMLALKTVLSRADETPTLIFDEIDSGIGGRIGAVVGQKLWSLAAEHQVLVVTHLPQLAGFSDMHFKVEKRRQGSRTVTHVTELARDKQIDELTAMLGAEAESARQSAQEILTYVDGVKKRAAASVGGRG